MSALERPGFRRLVVGWGFSNFGDSVLYLTLAIWAKDMTGRDSAAGLVFLFLGLPFFLAPLAGFLADRMSRRRLAAAANLVGAVLVMGLWSVQNEADIWIIYLVTFGYGLITYVTSAAGSGLVRDLLPDELLASGNGILSTIDQGLRLVSPLIGAGSYTIWGGQAIAMLTATMLVLASIVISTVTITETPPSAREGRESFWAETTAGFSHIRQSPTLTRITVSMAAAFMITGLANITIFAAIEQGLNKGPEWFGVFAAIQGGGAVLGGISAAALIARIEERGAITASLVVLGAGLAMPAVSWLPVFVVAAFLIGLAIPSIVVGFTTICQRLTPATLQGRVSAARNMALNGPQTIGTAVGAALISIVDYRILMLGMGAGIACCAIPMSKSTIDEGTPDLAEESNE